MGLAGGTVPVHRAEEPCVWQILIVEDDDLVAGSLIAVLEELEYGIAGLAASARRGLEIALQTEIDLALIDVHIAGELDGLALAEQLELLDIPFVILTGAWSSRLDAMNASGQRRMALLKPYSVEALREAIEQALAIPSRQGSKTNAR